MMDIIAAILTALATGLHFGARFAADAQVHKGQRAWWKKYTFLAQQRVDYRVYAKKVDFSEERVVVYDRDTGRAAL